MSRAVWEWHRTQPSTTEIMALFGKHPEKPLSQAEDVTDLEDAMATHRPAIPRGS